MTDEEAIGFEARLYALRYMVGMVFNVVYAGRSEEQITELEQEMRAAIRTRTLSFLEPALSDHVSALVADEIEAVLDMAKAHRASANPSSRAG